MPDRDPVAIVESAEGVRVVRADLRDNFDDLWRRLLARLRTTQAGG